MASRVGIVPVLRGGLGMIEAMIEMVSNAQDAVQSCSRLKASWWLVSRWMWLVSRWMPSQRCNGASPLRGARGRTFPRNRRGQVWHLGIYRDKTSLLPVEYYNKLPKKRTVRRRPPGT